jgi:eukaryotic-like serine/threonine-protein kinase
MWSVSQPDEEDELSKGPSLSADGRLEQRMQRVEPAFGPPPEEKLELAEVAPRKPEPRIENFREDPRPKSLPLAVKVVFALLALGVVVLVAFLVLKPNLDVSLPTGVTESSLLAELGGGEHEPIIISSTPTGATVSIAGKAVGVTPWAGDNVWIGTVPVSIDAKGFKRWEGQLVGGKAQTLDITLKR